MPRSSPPTLDCPPRSVVSRYRASGSISPRIALSPVVSIGARSIEVRPRGLASDAIIAAFPAEASGAPLRSRSELVAEARPRSTSLAPRVSGNARGSSAVLTHGGAGGGTVVVADRVVDQTVLALERIEVSPPAADPHGLARDDETAEILQEARELRVSRRLGDRAVKEIVLVDRGLVAGDRPVHRRERLTDAAELLRRGALGRKTCRLDLDGHAEFHEIDYRLDRLQALGIDPERPSLRIAGDEGTESLPGGDHALGAESRHRLAHDGAADAERRHHLLLG